MSDIFIILSKKNAPSLIFYPTIPMTKNFHRNYPMLFWMAPTLKANFGEFFESFNVLPILSQPSSYHGTNSSFVIFKLC